MSLHSPQPVPRPETLTDLAYQQLRAAILDGEFDSGRSTSVVSLAAKMQMSRSPVRSAVERLTAEGLMIPTAGGVFVPAPDRHDLLDALAVRAPLEGLAARLAAPQFDAYESAALAEIHERFSSAVAGDDPRTARKADLEFHQRIQSVCGNACLVQMLERVQARVILATYSTAWSTNQRAAVPEHARIMSALGDQDGEAAEKAAILHLHNLTDRIRLEWKRRSAEAERTAPRAAAPA
jgi:DNA-binding GntR family transcriptional regulator